jgi:Zn-dependent peptidase ImmA (M78 family)
MIRTEIENLAKEKFSDAGCIVPVPVVEIAKKLGITISEVVMPDFQGIKPSGILNKNQGTWTILLNNADSSVRKRFTIAHEIGHYLLHSTESSLILDDFPAGETFYRLGLDDPKEKDANYFAACLLMPEDQIKNFWLSGEFKNPAELANRFNVSEVSITYRLKSLSLID